NFNSRCNTIAFGKPFSIRAKQPGIGNSDTTSVNQIMSRCGSYQDTQCTFSNNRSHVHTFKGPGKSITTTPGPSIDEHSFGSIIALTWYPAYPGIAPGHIVQGRAIQHFNKPITQLTARIETFIDDKSFFIDLCIELAH